MTRDELQAHNRLSWNEATRAHNSHKRDQARFLREGGSTLFPEEVELLGDVRGKRLLHLCCNAGQDTLSLAARHGARVTGVDLSDEAVAFATRLSAESGIPARFVRADAYAYLRAPEPCEVAFLSYGALTWLDDLGELAAGIARALVPGGRLVVLEFHPVLFLFDEGWRLHYPYSTRGEPIRDPGVSDYVGLAGGALSPSGHLEGERDFRNPHPCFSFGHGLGELVTACARAGLRVELLREYPYANGYRFGPMRAEGRRSYPPQGFPELPLMFGLVASR